jgi:ATP-dependent DNA helicase PIF1
VDADNAMLDVFNGTCFISDETEIEDSQELECEFVTGGAGTGKTTLIRKRQMETSNYAQLCATTGIAAINLGEGVTTIHSALQFYDYNSALESYSEGRMQRIIRQLIERDKVRRIVIDEVSMLPGRLLDLIYNAFNEVVSSLHTPFGLVLTGDFCQLPPITERGKPIDWAFNANCWPRFEANTTKLTKVWRQENVDFLAGLQALREGDGKKGVDILRSLKEIKWRTSEDPLFDGTTIIPIKDKVKGYNLQRLHALDGKAFEISSYRWTSQDDENPRINYLKQWDEIPPSMIMKEGALVMIKANDTKSWNYANGSLARVIGKSGGKDQPPKLILQLVRNDMEIHLPLLVRQHLTKRIPNRFKQLDIDEWPKGRQTSKSLYPNPDNPSDATYYDETKDKWVLAECIYFPVDYAWATTVHKSQGLTMETVQINIKPEFFGNPAMSYVALSRVRTPEGLTIVGTPSMLQAKVKVSPEVLRWL